MTMTLEQVRDWHLSKVALYREEAYPRGAQRHQKMADAIDAHFTKPAQSVDVEKVREVIAELRAYNPRADEYSGKYIHPYWADKLTAALQEKGNG